MILGIDEAGRGPVLGPLVLCGVWLSPEQERELAELGVRDSKAFGSDGAAREERARLGGIIRERALHVAVLVAEAAEVDHWVWRDGLDPLERSLAARIIESGPEPESIVADGRRLFRPLCARFARLESRDRADQTCTAVAAASIVAKAERDARFAAIVAPFEAELGPVSGGGYCNAGTARLLREHQRRFGTLPPQVRRSWTWDVLLELCAGEAPDKGQLQLGT